MKKYLYLKIIISTFILYTLVGFFLIPYIVKTQAIKNLDNLLITKTSIEKVKFNPFDMKLEIDSFSLKENENTLISLDKLVLDFAVLKSIHESHISFKDLVLDKPFANAILNEENEINLAKLLKPSEAKTDEPENSSNESSIPNFKISKLQIKEGNFLFNQIFNGKTTSTSLNGFNYTFYEVGTYKNALASHNLVTKINKDTQLNIKGGFRLIPFKMYGKVKLENLKANEYLGYSKDLLNFTIANPNLNLDFGYKIDTSKDLLLYVDNMNFKLNNLKLIKEKEEIITLSALNISDLNLDLAKQKIDIESISLDKLIANIVSNKSNKLNLDNLVNIKKEKEVKDENNESKPWFISLNDFSLNNSQAYFNDMKNKMRVTTKNIDIVVKNSIVNNKDINVESLNLKNINVNIKDKTDIKLNNINVALKDISYINNEVKISNTKLSTKNIQIDDKLSKTNINAKNIDVHINNLLQNNKVLKLSSIDLNKPIASIVLGKKEQQKAEDKKENKTKVNTKKPTDKKSSSKAINLDIGPVNIKNAQLSFQDKNLPIPFKTNITKLNGKISELKSNSSKPSKLKVEGKIDKYGYTRITGLVDHRNIKNLTDVNMIFKNIEVKNFTPYTGKFVGRKLDGGKLNLNLKYNIKKSNLEASNSIIITDIKLGDVVESVDAMSLPLELGIALLEDSDGVIDLDIPISGDLDNPQFSIGPIVWKAVTNLIVKAVSAPFSFLASLLGIDEDEINSAEFIYGESKVIDSEKESLDKIAKAFAKRPNIALKITGAYDKTKDTTALQYLKIENLLKEDMKKIKAEDPYLVALEKRYLTLEEKTKLKELKKTFMIKTKEKKEIFDKDSYVKYLKEKIVKSIEIKENELNLLAQNRIKSIIAYLDEAHGIKSNRVIVIDEIKILDDKEANYAKFDLEIDIKKK